ncbi:hypothetical protein SPRG_13852 [Saprolegnia parasitica CBS 223.65]|uniref:Uncharacterized protein n=1 Tax=Saprolegnia parasitica (strain CBS 223.65) TaxID=695850 RepID=A0A067BRB6_SAPPC|nr:hypothetical protein SPRG_13852 [Saprolegnia parasitica CBS 223.65]KDO21059.1 hypothetical protein SPRG_13852 [Saprolegnia parasitica CBS 223.65]|eukprot:XP_012208238.1 hypothetical protein SPRG_13852 [Saprolegnia parasitica CBS 223.65]
MDSTIAMVLVSFSQGRHYDDRSDATAETPAAANRAASLAQIRRNLMTRRHKLSAAQLNRSQLIAQFEAAPPPPRKVPRSVVYASQDDTLATPADAATGRLCRYSTGKCRHVRAQKADGTYLNLCHMHRIRANANQRKLDRKKSLRLRQCDQAVAHGRRWPSPHANTQSA